MKLLGFIEPHSRDNFSNVGAYEESWSWRWLLIIHWHQYRMNPTSSSLFDPEHTLRIHMPWLNNLRVGFQWGVAPPIHPEGEYA